MTKTELMETYTPEQLAEMVVELQNGKGNKVFKVKDNKNYQKELEEFLKESPIKSTIERICRDITDQKNNAMAMEFTRVICDLLKENGVYVRCIETKFSENITENSIEEKYGIIFDGVDFSEHDKEFTDKIEELQSEVEKYRKAFEDAKNERDCQIAKYQKEIEELENHHKFSMMQIDDVLVEFLGVTHEVMDRPRDFEKVLQEVIDKSKTVSDFLPTEPIKVADMLINADGEYEHNPIEKALCG